MTRKEIVLNKLKNLPEEEMRDAIKQLTLHVSARLRKNSSADRTKWGAHTEEKFGMDPVKYYVGESIKRLFDPDGWDWKFEKLTLVQQLTRIANKLILDQVAKFKKQRGKNPKFVSKEISEIYDLADQFIEEDDHEKKVNEKLIKLAFEVSENDENLFFFTELYFEDKDYPSIAKELGISIEDVYALRKKLVRRLMKHKESLI